MQTDRIIYNRKFNGTIDRVLLHSDPILAAEDLSSTIVHRFWKKVNKTESCWLWTGATDEKGGVLGRGGVKAGNIMARRISWLIHFGAVPEHKRIKMACGQKLCCNPAHLKLGGGEMPIADSAATARTEALNAALASESDYSAQDPTLPTGFSRTFRDRFWAKVRKTETCWIWTGHVNEDGYGQIGIGKTEAGLLRSHQASWVLHNGPIPEGMKVLHNCPGKDNPSCVNPAHLWLGTPKENSIDATKKRAAEGKAHWSARLTLEQVSEIRQLFATGGHTKAALGRQFGCSAGHICRLVNRTRAAQIP